MGTGSHSARKRCGNLNPWCECCGCEKKPGHSGRHRVTYSADRIARWNAEDTARAAAAADDAFRTRIITYTNRYRRLMHTGRQVRIGEAVAADADEHRLHGGLIMLYGLIIDAIVAFRSRQVRMSDEKLHELLTTYVGAHADDLLAGAATAAPLGVGTARLEHWYGVTRPPHPSAEPSKVRVGRRRLKF